MVPISAEATNTIISTISARGATLTPPFPGVKCARNTARCAAGDDGGSNVLPGVEDPMRGSRRMPQRALKQGYMWLRTSVHVCKLIAKGQRATKGSVN